MLREDYHTSFEKNILTNGKCQLIIKQIESFKWLADIVFNTEAQADKFLRENWEYYCKISEEIYYAGVYAMERAYQDFKDGFLY